MFCRQLRLATCYIYLLTTYYLVLIPGILRPNAFCPLLPRTCYPFQQLLRFFLSHASAADKERACDCLTLGPDSHKNKIVPRTNHSRVSPSRGRNAHPSGGNHPRMSTRVATALTQQQSEEKVYVLCLVLRSSWASYSHKRHDAKFKTRTA